MDSKLPICPPRRLAASIAFLALCWPFVAAADCTARKPRAAEVEFNARAMAALAAALPPLPAGVQMRGGTSYDFKSAPDVYEVLCDFSKEGDFSISTRRSYVRKHTEAERKYWDTQYDALQTQAGVLRKLPAEKVAQEQALRQQSNAQWQATRDAEKAGDKAAAQARDAQYRALRNQADAIPGAYRPTSARGGADVCTRGRSARRAPHGDVGTGNGPAAPRRPRPDQQRSRRSVGARTRRHADRRPCAVGAPGCGAG